MVFLRFNQVKTYELQIMNELDDTNKKFNKGNYCI
jgi:hypothetical protein